MTHCILIYRNSGGCAIAEPLDLKSVSCLEEVGQAGLLQLHLAMVDEPQEGAHVTLLHVTQNHYRVLARVGL